MSITTDDAEVYHLDLIGCLAHVREVATLRQHHLFVRSDFTLFNSKLLYVKFGNALSCRVCLSSTSVERTGRTPKCGLGVTSPIPTRSAFRRFAFPEFPCAFDSRLNSKVTHVFKASDARACLRTLLIGCTTLADSYTENAFSPFLA